MPDVFDFFFAQVGRVLNAGLSILDQFVSSPVTGKFMKLFLVVFAFIMIMKYVIFPLLFDSGSSDQVKGTKKDKKRSKKE